MEKTKFSGWTQLVMVALITGICSNFFGSCIMISNTIMKTSGQVAMSATTFGVGVSFYSLMQGIPQPFVGKLVRKKGSKKVLFVGTAASIILGLGASNLLNSDISYVIVYGILWGICYMLTSQLATQTLINNWFVKRRGQTQMFTLVIPTSLAIVGPLIANWLIKNYGGGNFHFGWYVGGVMSIVAFILCFFLKDKPEDIGQYADGIAPGEEIKIKAKATKILTVYKRPENEEIGVKKALKMPLLWFAVVASTLGFVTVMIYSACFSIYAVELGFDMNLVASALGIRNLGMIAIILLCAMLADRIEPSILYGGYFILYGAALIIWNTPSSVFQVYALSFLNSGLSACTLGLAPTIYANCFGKKVFPEIQGIALLVGGLGSFTTGTIVGLIKDSVGSYAPAFIVYGSLALVGAACWIFGVGIPLLKKNKTELIGN